RGGVGFGRHRRGRAGGLGGEGLQARHRQQPGEALQEAGIHDVNGTFQPGARTPWPPANRIKADAEVVEVQDIDKAYERILAKDVRYRFVIDMASPESA